MRHLILLLALQFIALPVELFAQNYFGYEYDPEAAKGYYPTASQIREAAVANVPGGYKDNDTVKEFIEVNTMWLEDMLDEYYVYPGWEEMENYLNAILAKLVPEDTIRKYNLHIYPSMDPSVNASATHPGVMFFNVGFFAFANDESTLAEVIGHEVAHVMHRDGMKGYLNYTRNKGKRVVASIVSVLSGGWFGGVFVRSLFQFNQTQESSADVRGWEMMNRAGYDLTSARYLYKLFSEIEKRYASGGSSILYNRSHPPTKNRLGSLNTFIKDHYKNDGKQFLVNEDRFLKLRELARAELLKQLLEVQDYNECMERALQFHIMDDKNPVYVYYILSAMHKYMYVYMNCTMGPVENKHFVMHYHSLHQRTQQKGYGNVYGSILNHSNLLSSLYTDSAQWAAIKDHPLVDKEKIEFRSFQDALIYFSAKARELSCTECYLQIGLHHYARNNYWKKKPGKKDIVNEQEWLDMYIKAPNTRYDEFAKSLKDGTVSDGLDGELMFVDFNFPDYGEDKPNAATVRDAAIASYKDVLARYFSDRKVSLVFQDEFDALTIKEQMMSNEISRVFESIFDAYTVENKELRLTLFDPRYWEYARKREVKAIYFLTIKDDRDFDKSGGKIYAYVKTKAFHFDSDKYTICKTSKGGMMSDESSLRYHIKNTLKSIDSYCWDLEKTSWAEGAFKD